MAMKFVVSQGWEYEPPSLCSLGVNSGSQSQSSSGWSNTYPTNMQNPAFQGNAKQTSDELNGIGAGNALGIQGNGNLWGLSPLSVYGSPSNSSSNPLVAPVTGAQSSTLEQIGNLIGQTPGNLASAYGLLSTETNPGFAQSLATSPATQAAEQAAIAPVRQQFTSQTVPGLEGSFTGAGQRVGSASGAGSSAFDTAFATAQGNEMATEAATTGAIANNAYQTGLNIQANAPSQMAALNNAEMSTLISGLNAQALPQLTQQYGISAGTQLYQTQMNTILQALGLQVQGAQPVIGYYGQSGSTESQRGSNSGFGVQNPFSTGR